MVVILKMITIVITGLLDTISMIWNRQVSLLLQMAGWSIKIGAIVIDYAIDTEFFHRKLVMFIPIGLFIKVWFNI